jgi:hypothetical protein
LTHRAACCIRVALWREVCYTGGVQQQERRDVVKLSGDGGVSVALVLLVAVVSALRRGRLSPQSKLPVAASVGP